MAEMSVRQWQERFRAGDFNSRDLSVQCEAGWFDWFCRNDALAGRLEKLSKIVLGIKAPFILDNYYVWFKNNCPMAGPLYDDVRFEPLSGEREGKYFVVILDCPHELAKWALYTERYGYDAPEFFSGNVRNMVQYINGMAAELEQGIQPAFLLEKRVVSKYVLRHEGEHGIQIPCEPFDGMRVLAWRHVDHVALRQAGGHGDAAVPLAAVSSMPIASTPV